ncbi:MAG: hypothetical protein ACE5LB_04420 [Acidiferrobacterales bacterium]
MRYPNYHPASLNKSGLDTLTTLENDLDKVVVALTADAPVAQLSDEQLNRLREAEQKLGIVLVAYEQN